MCSEPRLQAAQNRVNAELRTATPLAWHRDDEAVHHEGHEEREVKNAPPLNRRVNSALRVCFVLFVVQVRSPAFTRIGPVLPPESGTPNINPTDGGRSPPCRCRPVSGPAGSWDLPGSGVPAERPETQPESLLSPPAPGKAINAPGPGRRLGWEESNVFDQPLPADGR